MCQLQFYIRQLCGVWCLVSRGPASSSRLVAVGGKSRYISSCYEMRSGAYEAGIPVSKVLPSIVSNSSAVQHPPRQFGKDNPSMLGFLCKSVFRRSLPLTRNCFEKKKEHLPVSCIGLARSIEGEEFPLIFLRVSARIVENTKLLSSFTAKERPSNRFTYCSFAVKCSILNQPCLFGFV